MLQIKTQNHIEDLIKPDFSYNNLGSNIISNKLYIKVQPNKPCLDIQALSFSDISMKRAHRGKYKEMMT